MNPKKDVTVLDSTIHDINAGTGLLGMAAAIPTFKQIMSYK